MYAFICLGANQSESGSFYRLEIGCGLHPRVASIVWMIARLI